MTDKELVSWNEHINRHFSKNILYIYIYIAASVV